MSAAPSWPLVIVAPRGQALPKCGCGRPSGLFRSISRAGRSHSGPRVLNLFFLPSKRKTTRGARPSSLPPVRTISSRTAKARNCLFSQRPAREPPPLRAPAALSCSHPIWDDDHGESRGKPQNPHTFSCSRASRHPFCTSFAGSRAHPAIHILFQIPELASRVSLRSPGIASDALPLLELDLRASLLKLGLDLVGFFLVHAFLDVLRRAFDEVLGFLQTKTGDGANFLDDLDLLLAGRRQHDREFGLLFRRSSSTAAAGRRASNRDCGRGRDAPLLFQELCEFGRFEHGQAREVVDDFLQVSH